MAKRQFSKHCKTLILGRPSGIKVEFNNRKIIKALHMLENKYTHYRRKFMLILTKIQ
jgi:hypothetical protein